MALSRSTPSGWVEETGTISRSTPSGWLQETTSTGVSGSIAVTEAGSDTAVLAGDVIVQGPLAVTEAADTAALAGDVIVQGPLAVTEAGSDTAAFAGDVIVQGTLAATETGSDTAAFTSTSTSTGTLAVTEAGSDTASIAGDVIVNGTLAATEVGSDTASMASNSSTHYVTAASVSSQPVVRGVAIYYLYFPEEVMINNAIMSVLANGSIAYAGGSARCVFEAAFADPLGIAASRNTARVVSGPAIAVGAAVTVTLDAGGAGMDYTVREIEPDAAGLVTLFLS